MDRIGVTKEEFQQKLARIPRQWIPQRESEGGTSSRNPNPVTWMGARLKNLIGEAEKSAAGMGEETGVLCVDVPAESAAYGAGLRNGDIVIGLNQERIDTLTQLIEAFVYARDDAVPLTVFNAVARTLTLERLQWCVLFIVLFYEKVIY